VLSDLTRVSASFSLSGLSTLIFPPAQSEVVQRMAISYAAYRVLSHRFANSPGHAESQAAFDALMKRLGYSINHTQTHGQSPAAVGNRIAAKVLAETQNDGANEAGNYADTTGYQPVNPPRVVAQAEAGDINDINRWQPLQVPGAPPTPDLFEPPLGEGHSVCTPAARQRLF
jgi:hypothetical protein